ncbi:MAG: hypothetical protein JWN10_2899 [Solirubrobacterales bacterium]|nr:hypothetical protein [Solirubrobacterales bacterium]
MRASSSVAAVVGTVLLVSACGAHPSVSVQANGPLAFSHCMRARGLSQFPDPNSAGVWPKSQVEVVAGDPKFEAATQACGHLLPDGGPGVPPSSAVVQLIQTDMAKFAQCMRSHGVPDWPDPSLDRGRAVFDPEAVGIDTSAPRITTAMRGCESVFPPSLGHPPGT